MRKNNIYRKTISVSRGFTLLEILIALFIFTLLSMILVDALHNVINSLSETENKAERLRKLQMALLVMSRDIEQTVNRPVINSAGKKEPAFIGSAHSFTFTHTGVANLSNNMSRSALQRVAYQWSDNHLSRVTWAVLDEAPKSQPFSRVFLSGVIEAHFEYFDKNGRFYNDWPLSGQGSDVLPRGVRVYLTLAQWGTMTQLYLIPARASAATQTPGAPTPPGTTPPVQPTTTGEKKADIKQ